MNTLSIKRLVLDCSVTMAWCFSDEASKHSLSILELMEKAEAHVPNIWPLEVANILWFSEKKHRIDRVQSHRFRTLLNEMSIIVDKTTSELAMWEIFEMARDLDLTIYDTAYLELAVREKLPLATLDGAMQTAARRLGVTVL